MKKLILTAAAAASLAMLSNAAQAQCMIYPERYYKGGEGIIQPNDFVVFTKELSEEEAPEGYRVYFDPSWLNNLNSSRTTNSCILARIGHARDLSGVVKAKGNTPNFETKEVVGAFCACP
jgi:hypothetical protein